MTDDDKALVKRLRSTVCQGNLGCHRLVDDDEAANRIEAQAAEIERLREAIERQASAIRTLHANEQTEINTLRKKRHEWHHAVSSLESEREANALLTAEIERLTAERDALAGIVRGWHWLAVGPDEMGDYLHQRELIKASEPYASPALRAIAAGTHKKQTDDL
jgi:SMC interacting uncharacterized protein involved in chromosome segregation